MMYSACQRPVQWFAVGTVEDSRAVQWYTVLIRRNVQWGKGGTVEVGKRYNEVQSMFSKCQS